MKQLYITTDSYEAEALIEDTPLNQEPEYKYRDIESQEGINLVKKLGFNPMCSVELNESVSARVLDEIVARLVKEGLFVAVESGGKVTRHVPKDREDRDEIVRLALLKERGKRYYEDSCCAILIYSNNPYKIRTSSHDRI